MEEMRHFRPAPYDLGKAMKKQGLEVYANGEEIEE